MKITKTASQWLQISAQIENAGMELLFTDHYEDWCNLEARIDYELDKYGDSVDPELEITLELTETQCELITESWLYN